MLREKLSTSVLIQIINFSNWVPLRCDISYLAMLLLSIKTISDRRLFLLLFFQNVTVVRFAISSTVQLFSVGLVDRNVHFVWLIHLKSKKKKNTIYDCILRRKFPMPLNSEMEFMYCTISGTPIRRSTIVWQLKYTLSVKFCRIYLVLIVYEKFDSVNDIDKRF